MSGAAAPSAAPSPDVKPSHVVNQIAQQVDLYRLPGGRGVRIHLSPEGLGGVEVTVRYGATGAVELHMNLEHAATADLVQAGWGELRDALALQGISPERLIMNVTSPASSGFSDQYGSGSQRSDAQSMAGHSGQQHEHQFDSRTNRGWSASLDSITDADDAPVVASTSRIDYRA
jgi:flagellar hook-length control protein FliK